MMQTKVCPAALSMPQKGGGHKVQAEKASWDPWQP